MTHDHLTVLTTFGPLATKRVRRDEGGAVTVDAYGNAKHYRVQTLRVGGFGSLARRLNRLLGATTSFLIRGEPLPSTDRARCRRLAYDDKVTGGTATFREVSRRWLLLDFDTVKAPDWLDAMEPTDAVRHLRDLLPDEFSASSFWWSYTSSAGFKPGQMRMRTAFWLDRPVSEAELERWLGKAPVDRSLFRTVQPNYIAAPVFEGVADPVPQRAGIYVDVDDTVPVPELPKPIVEARPVAKETNGTAAGTTVRRGWQYDIMEEVARKIVAAPEAGTNAWGGNGRHNALFCGALRCSALIRDGFVPEHEAVTVLTAAGRKAGLLDKRIVPTIANGLSTGGIA